MTQGKLQEKIRAGNMKPFITICPHDTVGECDCHIRWILEIVKDARKDFAKIWNEEMLGGTISQYVEVLREIAKVELEVHGKLGRTSMTILPTLEWFLEQFGR